MYFLVNSCSRVKLYSIFLLLLIVTFCCNKQIAYIATAVAVILTCNTLSL